MLNINRKIKNSLRRRLSPKTPKSFHKFGDVCQTLHGPMIYQDNGADILAVAHLDYVDYLKPHFKGNTVFCPQLDDRLGAWVILDVLPSLGLKYDILLTDSEECGQSTAQYFTSEKEYRWIFEFDRAGDDVVMYDYETHDLCDNLMDHGYEVGFGSFTDICSLTQLGVAGFNFGVGYHFQHTRRCRANLKHTAANLLKFVSFYEEFSDERFDYVPYVKPFDTSRRQFTTTVADEFICPYCGDDYVYFRDKAFCRYCDESSLRAELFPDEARSFHDLWN